MDTSSLLPHGLAESVLRLSPEHLAQAEVMAEGAWPYECCGVLVGCSSGRRQTDVLDVWLARNMAVDRRRRFRIPPEDLISAQRRARTRGLRVVGYFHSHPEEQPMPSDLDVDLAWPGLSYLIVEVRRGRSRGASCWRIEDGQALAERIDTLNGEATR